MGVSYYDALLPACEPGVGLPGVVAGIRGSNKWAECLPGVGRLRFAG